MADGRRRLPADQLTQTIQTANHEWVLAFGFPNGFTVPALLLARCRANKNICRSREMTERRRRPWLAFFVFCFFFFFLIALTPRVG